MFRSVDNKWNKRGFTLAEVLIVMAIVIILAGVSVPVFGTVLKNHRAKQVNDQETAAKAAAIAAFYAGYDSKNNQVKLEEKGFCTFLYDAENSAVYVLNTDAHASDFYAEGYSIDDYGIKVDSSHDYSGKVILVTFDGRYYSIGADRTSKGAMEEPIIKYKWE